MALNAIEGCGCAALFAVSMLLGCSSAAAGNIASGTVSRATPRLCDSDELGVEYFGSNPQEQFAYNHSSKSVVWSHGLLLCRASEAPLISIQQSSFLRCVWYRADEDPLVVSLGEDCSLVGRQPSCAEGRCESKESRRVLAGAECSTLLASTMEAARQGPGASSLPPGMVGLDGDALYFEARDGERLRAGYVDTPAVGEKATGAVRACMSVREALMAAPVAAPR